MGFFDLRDKRESVQKVRAQQRREQLKLNRDIKDTARKERIAELKRKKLESSTATARAEEKLYETQLRRKQAKRAKSPFPSLPTYSLRVKKRKQGRKLSSGKRITLL